jgi:hypothetical protein
MDTPGTRLRGTITFKDKDIGTMSKAGVDDPWASFRSILNEDEIRSFI